MHVLYYNRYSPCDETAAIQQLLHVKHGARVPVIAVMALRHPHCHLEDGSSHSDIAEYASAACVVCVFVTCVTAMCIHCCQWRRPADVPRSPNR